MSQFLSFFLSFFQFFLSFNDVRNERDSMGYIIVEYIMYRNDVLYSHPYIFWYVYTLHISCISLLYRQKCRTCLRELFMNNI